MATLVIVVGVAGALYSRKGDVAMEAQPVTVSAQSKEMRATTLNAPAALNPSAADQLQLAIPAGAADEDAPEPEPTAGYRVGLAEEQTEGAIATAKDSYDEVDERKADLSRSSRRGRMKSAPARRDDLQFDSTVSKPNDPGFGHAETANVVSGSRGFADAPAGDDGLREAQDKTSPRESERSRKATKAKPKSVAKKKMAQPPPPANRPQAKQELSWEAQQTATLAAAARAKRCLAAGRIANDILDKKPDYYKKNVAGTKAVSDCRSYVASETRRRAKARSKRAAQRSKKAAGVPSKAKAAPQDESSLEAAE
jgi:hypothetical protein